MQAVLEVVIAGNLAAVARPIVYVGNVSLMDKRVDESASLAPAQRVTDVTEVGPRIFFRTKIGVKHFRCTPPNHSAVGDYAVAISHRACLPGTIQR